MAKQISIDYNEINLISKRLNQLKLTLSPKVRKKIYRRAAKLLIASARSKINDSGKVHHRYKDGKIIATYYPGNLRKSIQVLKLKRARNAIYVGPKVAKRNRSGAFGQSSRVDGYYAHIVEFGSVYMSGLGYMRRSFADSKNAMLFLIKKEIIRELRKTVNRWR